MLLLIYWGRTSLLLGSSSVHRRMSRNTPLLRTVVNRAAVWATLAKCSQNFVQGSLNTLEATDDANHLFFDATDAIFDGPDASVWQKCALER